MFTRLAPLKLAGLIVVDVDEDAIGDRTVGARGELDVRNELRQRGKLTGHLHGFVAGTELRPVAPELAAPPQ